MSNKKIIVTSVVLAIVLIVGALIYSGRQKEPEISTEKTPGIAIGSESAPVTIEEYTNFLCSYCADFAFDVWPKIKDKYVATGKVKFEIYVVSYIEVGQAAYCASEGGKYFEFQDYTFERVNELIGSVGNDADQKIFDYARAVGLDIDEFKDCYVGLAAVKAAEDWLDKVRETGIGSTPTFIINGEKVVGVVSFEEFDEVIQSKLK